MAYWKLGCNWGQNGPDFYDVVINHNIVICAQREMSVGDIVAISRGITIWAIAKVVSTKVPVTSRLDLQEDFESKKIDYSEWNNIADAEITILDPSSRFQIRDQKGICRIKKTSNINKVNFALNPSIPSTYMIEECKELLTHNYNLILTGAPGTGKTHLAFEIAKAMGCENPEFVQFHPSYDYTDFVEGLRPEGNEGKANSFVRMDGVMKAFCKKALENTNANLVSTLPTPTITSSLPTFQEIYDSIVEDIRNKVIKKYIQKDGKARKLVLKVAARSKVERIYYRDGLKPELESNIELMYNDLLANSVRDVRGYSKDDLWKLIQKVNGKTKSVDTSEYRWILQTLLNRYYKKVDSSFQELPIGKQVKESKAVDTNSKTQYFEKGEEVNSAPFVIIIDEINRGEISKIFGELFFSVDPGYRGFEHKVKTQYQNLISPNGNDPFRNGFFIPKNVYIIGTMNDIDRSVESMDFAMRRRFAWKEVDADDTQNMLDKSEAWKIKQPDSNTIKLIKNRMDNLNACIIDQNIGDEVPESEKIGLTSAYQIGASYFLKYEKYNDFDKLWDFHLKGLLYEYLRGTTDVQGKIDKLKAAYDNDNPMQL